MGITKEAQEYLINVEKQRLKLLKGPGGQDSASGFVEDQRREGKKLAGQADGNKFQRIAQNRLRGSAKQPKPDNLYDNPRGLPKQPKPTNVTPAKPSSMGPTTNSKITPTQVKTAYVKARASQQFVSKKDRKAGK